MANSLWAAESWPLWDAFKNRFLDSQGRVVDHDAKDRTTSEGQAYGLFFALVANDRANFDRILSWTETNLAAGDLKTRLPGWLWGRATDGSWRILDSNSASDADLWIAYSLLQAGSLWSTDRYSALGSSVAERIAADEVDVLPGLGAMLLPGSRGFHPTRNLYILNASYVPLQLIWNLAAQFPGAPWNEIGLNVPKLLTGSSSRGWPLDWIAYDADRGFEVKDLSKKQARASYDAIRVYLWAGMLDESTFLRKEVLDGISKGMLSYLNDRLYPPAEVTWDGVVESADSNIGFTAAVIPLLHVLGETTALADQTRRMQREWVGATRLYGREGRYYDQCLALFSTGWQEKRFKFDANGSLNLIWNFRS